MRRSLLVLLFACAHSQQHVMTASGAPKAPVAMQAFFETRRLYGISFSPDEKWVAFASDAGGRPDLWVEPIEGGPATQITHVKGQLWNFDFAPSGDALVYQADEVGDENTRLYLTDHTGKKPVEITEGDPADKRAELVDWARDGKSFLYLSNRRDGQNMDLYRYDLDTGLSRLRWRGEGKIAFAGVSHDHRMLVLNETLSDVDSNLYLFDGKQRLLTPHKGNALYGNGDFSADDKTLQVTSDEGGEFQSLYDLELKSGEKKPVAQPQWDVEAAGYSPDYRYRYLQINEDGATALEIHDAQGKLVALPPAPQGGRFGLLDLYRTDHQWRSSASGRYLGVGLYGGGTPSVPYVIDLQSGTAHPVADVLPEALRAQKMANPEVVRVDSFDGKKVPGFVYRPERPNGAAIINVHGGPTAQTLQRFSPLTQYLASKGYVVFEPNVRGSTGYGKTWMALDNKDFGGGPLKDVVACKQWLVQNAGVKADKVVVLGGSYGGYMALAAAAFTPDQFAANVDLFGISELKTLVQGFPAYWLSGIGFIHAKFGNPDDPRDEAYLHDRSPLYSAEKITRPLLVVQGDKDVRVQKEQSDKIVEALRKNKVPVHYIVLENEGHGFARNENRTLVYAATDRFLDKYLFGDASVTVEPPAAPAAPAPAAAQPAPPASAAPAQPAAPAGK